MNMTSLVLIVSDIRRRAEVAFTLSHMNLHVEPFETISEISPGWSGADAVLIHDEQEALTQVTNWMRDRDMWLPVLVYAEAPVPAQIVRAVQEGASDYLAWPFDHVDLRQALARAGEHSHRTMSSKRREFYARGLIAQLTRREMQVLECMANGLPNKEIGRTLDISPRTVEIHRAKLMRRMGVQHSSEAIRIAIEAGIVGLHPIQRSVPPVLSKQMYR